MADMGDFRPRYAPPGMANTQNIEGTQNVPMSREELMMLLGSLPMFRGPPVQSRDAEEQRGGFYGTSPQLDRKNYLMARELMKGGGR